MWGFGVCIPYARPKIRHRKEEQDLAQTAKAHCVGVHPCLLILHPRGFCHRGFSRSGGFVIGEFVIAGLLLQEGFGGGGFVVGVLSWGEVCLYPDLGGPIGRLLPNSHILD